MSRIAFIEGSQPLHLVPNCCLQSFIDTCGVFWRDLLKVAKNFLGPEMPLSAFWQRLDYGETLSEEAEKVLGYLSQALSPLLLKESRQNDFAKMRKVAFRGQESSWLPSKCLAKICL